MNKIVELEPFFAEDSEGKRYKIHVYQDIISTDSLDGPSPSIGGLLRYRLSDSSTVSRISDTEFKIVKNGTRITRL